MLQQPELFRKLKTKGDNAGWLVEWQGRQSAVKVVKSKEDRSEVVVETHGRLRHLL